jgi:hypothetical protein
MANRIRIDTRLLNVNWTTGTTYSLELGAGLVQEVGNNRSLSAAQNNAKTFATFNGGPTLTEVSPVFGTTNSFTTTAVINYNRKLYSNAIPQEFFVKKQNSDGSSENVFTLSNTSSRVTLSDKTITINLKDIVDSSSTYYIDLVSPAFEDMFRFPVEAIDQNKFKYTTGRPNIDQVTPSYLTTGSFETTATISFDRNVKKRSGNFYVYEQGGTLVQTISTASSRVAVNGDNVIIDLKDIVDSNTTYYLTSDYGVVDDVLVNFRAEPISEAKFKYTTGRPNIDQVTPSYLTTGSFATTAVISFTRDVKKRSGNFYLYKKGIVDTLIDTIAVGNNRVTIDGDDVSIDLRYVLNGDSTYYIESDYGVVDDLLVNFRAEPISENNFKYSTGPGPDPVSVNPTYESSGIFVSTATITFSKNVSLYSNNVYLYNGEGVYRTFAANSSSLRVINGNTVEITLYDRPIPEDTYHIGFDLGTVIDANTFSAEPVIDDSLLKWTSLSLDNVKDLTYNSRIVNDFFEGNKPVIIDQDPNPMKGYRITLTASSGTFSAPFGFYDGDTWKYDSSREDLNDLFDEIQFEADVKDMNWDLAYNITLEKDDFEIVNRTKVMVGLPYDLENFQLVSNTFTNVVSSSTVLTVNANTSSPVSGLVTFRTTATVLGTSTFSANAASFSVPPNTLSLGTSSIYATWNGQIIVPKFNAAESNTIAQKTVPVGVTTSTMTLSPTEFYYHNIDGTTASNVAASVKIDSIYRTHEPLGSVQLFDGATLLATGNLTQGSNSSSVSINWNPLLFSQIDAGNKTISAVYAGDYWNQSTSTSAAFIARTRRIPVITLTPSVSRTGRYPFTLNATINTGNYHNGQFMTFYFDGILLGSSAISGNSASIVVDPLNAPFPLPDGPQPGEHIFTAQVSQMFAYSSATSVSAVVEYVLPILPELDIHSILPQPFKRYELTRFENTFVYSTLTIVSSELSVDGIFEGTITLKDGLTVLTSTSFVSTGTDIGKKYVFWNPTEKGQNDQGLREIVAEYSGDNYHYPTLAYSSLTANSRTVLNTSSFVTDAYTAEGFASTLTNLTVQVGAIDPRINENNYVDVFYKVTPEDRLNGIAYVRADTNRFWGDIDQTKFDVFVDETFLEFGNPAGGSPLLQWDRFNTRAIVYNITSSTQVIKIRNYADNYYADSYGYPDGVFKFYDGVISTSTLLATSTASLLGYYPHNQIPIGVVTATVALSLGSHNIITVLENDTYFEDYQVQHNVVKYDITPDWSVDATWNNGDYIFTFGSENAAAIPEERRGPARIDITFFPRWVPTTTTNTVSIIGPYGSTYAFAWGYSSVGEEREIAAGAAAGDPIPVVINLNNGNPQYEQGRIEGTYGFDLTNTNEFTSSINWWYSPGNQFSHPEGVGTIVPWYQQNFWFVAVYYGNDFPGIFETENSNVARAFPDQIAISGYVDGFGNLVLDQSLAAYLHPDIPNYDDLNP